MNGKSFVWIIINEIGGDVENAKLKWSVMEGSTHMLAFMRGKGVESFFYI